MTSALSDSIFMRPPRPCPSWRRARSRSRSSRFSGSPAGRPSTIAVRPGPWDSPLVVKRIDMDVPGYPSAWAGPLWLRLADAVHECGHFKLALAVTACERALADLAVHAVRAPRLALLRCRIAELDAMDPEQVNPELEVVDRQEVVEPDLQLEEVAVRRAGNAGALARMIETRVHEEDRRLGIRGNAHEHQRGDLLARQEAHAAHVAVAPLAARPAELDVELVGEVRAPYEGSVAARREAAAGVGLAEARHALGGAAAVRPAGEQ